MIMFVAFSRPLRSWGGPREDSACCGQEALAAERARRRAGFGSEHPAAGWARRLMERGAPRRRSALPPPPSVWRSTRLPRAAGIRGCIRTSPATPSRIPSAGSTGSSRARTRSSSPRSRTPWRCGVRGPAPAAGGADPTASCSPTGQPSHPLLSPVNHVSAQQTNILRPPFLPSCSDPLVLVVVMTTARTTRARTPRYGRGWLWRCSAIRRHGHHDGRTAGGGGRAA